ncbi:PTS mannose transporter subunit IID, partial [Listeria monocytogenes]|uniref:PTS system mannose/fructose/sorbose family transporter subunit IID n=1 Tax=Listeria monocytogenes TaxID=1639 RepID=UPI000D8B7F66
SIHGQYVMGALVNKRTTNNDPLLAYTTEDTKTGKDVPTTDQSILDQIKPGLHALQHTFARMRIHKKKDNAKWLIKGL